MDVSENSGTPKSSILIGFSIIKHPFWGSPIFGNTQVPFPPQHLRVFFFCFKPITKRWAFVGYLLLIFVATPKRKIPQHEGKKKFQSTTKATNPPQPPGEFSPSCSPSSTIRTPSNLASPTKKKKTRILQNEVQTLRPNGSVDGCRLSF